MDLDESKYSDPQPYKKEGYTEERVQLLNDWCRASLKKQTSQDFIFISLWDQIVPGDELDNEIQIRINRTGSYDDEPLDYEALLGHYKGKRTLNYADQIRDKVSELFDAPLLVTNLDCDDALHHKFVETLHEVVQQRDFDRSEPFYFSTATRYCYNIKTGAKGEKKTSSPSPFVSTWEPEIQCYPLRYNHSVLHRWVSGINVDGLLGLQTVNDTNMFSRGTGESAEFNVEDYV